MRVLRVFQFVASTAALVLVGVAGGRNAFAWAFAAVVGFGTLGYSLGLDLLIAHNDAEIARLRGVIRYDTDNHPPEAMARPPK